MIELLRRLFSHSFTKFCIVGVINTAVDFGVFALLYYIAHLGLVSANVLAFIAAVTNSFLFNKNWAFRGRGGAHPLLQYVLFFAISACGLGLNTLVLVYGAQYMPVMLAKCAGAAVTIFWNFFCYRYLVFNRTE